MFERVVLKYKKLVDKELDSYFRALLKENHVGYVDNEMTVYLHEFVKNGGKRLRPIFMTLAYLSKDDKHVNDVIKASLSLELLHNGTLIHDDIMDRSQLRRGEPTYHVAFQKWYNDTFQKHTDENFGMSMGILGGDLIITRAFTNVIDSGFPDKIRMKLVKLLSDAFIELCKGQALDMEMPLKKSTMNEYYDMIKGKTAALFRACAKMGLAIAEADEDYISTFSDFSDCLGVVFQIQDDILGTFGSVEKLGKPTDSDIKEGKSTILTIYAYEHADDEQKKVLDRVLGNFRSTKEEVEKVKQIIESTGAKQFAESKAREWLAKSKVLLHKLNMSGDPREFFYGIIDYMVKREF